MPRSVVVGYQRFGGLCCLHFHGEVEEIGENGTDVGLDQRWAAGAASQ